MKVFFLLFFSSIIFSSVSAQNPNFSNIYIDMDPDNCVSCISTLGSVQVFEAAKQPYYFVLKEKYKPEKDYFEKKYRLQRLKAEYIWNDSLYDFLHTQPGSSISLISATGANKIVVPLINFDPAIAQYFLEKCKLTDTIHYDHEILSPLINKMEICHDFLYSLKSLRKETIDVLNINTGGTAHLTLTDSISKVNFLHNFKSLKEWHQAAYIELPNNNEFYNFKVVNDTVFAVSKHNYIAAINGEDTGIASFYAMNVFFKGNFLKSYKIDPMSIYPAYYWTPDFNYYKGVFYFSILKPATNHAEHPSFMAEYKPEGEELVFQKYYEMTLPPEMPLTSNFVPPSYFQRNYFLVSLDNKLYNLKDHQETLSLPMLDNGKISSQFEAERFNYFIPPFQIDRDYLWFNYFPKGTKQLVSVKFSIQKQQAVAIRQINSPFLIPLFDDFDHNYIYIPIDNKTIVRTHLSTLKKQH